ncbi:hypothetical protein BS50DRAFT_49115 [Corynespora cassiicola Philippines]|uniref:Uncharacterized protein n=1 Tax=Corynespora cassiicola Philippines TaxID=1448308 RepID=A0A2T2NIA1_CORCC|nr:hypothetical protein BS50DRAFT_49115 [Corynespora cassiicola Philippines]
MACFWRNPRLRLHRRHGTLAASSKTTRSFLASAEHSWSQRPSPAKNSWGCLADSSSPQIPNLVTRTRCLARAVVSASVFTHTWAHPARRSHSTTLGPIPFAGCKTKEKTVSTCIQASAAHVVRPHRLRPSIREHPRTPKKHGAPPRASSEATTSTFATYLPGG